MKRYKALLAIVLAAGCGAAIAFGQTGAQTGAKLPGATYSQEDVQYFPPGPEIKRQREAAPTQPGAPGLLPSFAPAQPMQPQQAPAPMLQPVQPAQFQLQAAANQQPANQPDVNQPNANQPAVNQVPAAAVVANAPAGEISLATDSKSAAKLRENIFGLTEEAWGTVKAVWDFEIVRGADKKALVTVGTLVGGLVLMGFGYIAAGVISRWVGARLLSRLGLNKTAAAPLQKIVYYVLLITFAMLTLNILNVPITVFSFAGGAIAVGVGFGSQNIVNNFISGLILLGERPIRVGDVIEIDGRTGRVTEIGARSTRIATGNNFEVIVPNSKFLESQVVNWTLSDDRISTNVRVGVAYGSPTREVERLLKLAATEHNDVAKDPAPNVSFEDFADDALVFSVSFWIDLQSASKGKVESDLRFRIDELFNEAGIVIAYPQRDVHLNMMRPLEVRLAPEASRELRRVAA